MDEYLETIYGLGLVAEVTNQHLVGKDSLQYYIHAEEVARSTSKVQISNCFLLFNFKQLCQLLFGAGSVLRRLAAGSSLEFSGSSLAGP